MAQVKRVLLIVLLILVGVTSLLTMLGLIYSSGAWGSDNVIVGALGEGFLLVISLGAMNSLETRLVRVVGVAGMLLAMIMLVAMPAALLWMSSSPSGATTADWQTRAFVGKCVATGMIMAPAFCLPAYLLSLRMGLAGRISEIVTTAAVATNAGMLLAVTWFDNPPLGLEPLFFGSAILAVTGLIAVPVMHKFYRIKLPDVVTGMTGKIFLRCPRCLKEQEVATGESRCSACRLRFAIEVEEPRCPRCGYNLNALTRPVCPECGFALSPEEVAGPAVVG